MTHRAHALMLGALALFVIPVDRHLFEESLELAVATVNVTDREGRHRCALCPNSMPCANQKHHDNDKLRGVIQDGSAVVEDFVASGQVVGLPISDGSLLDFAHQTSKFTRQDFEPGHFTASSVLASCDGSEIFLIYHPKLERWLQPGGHFEASDSTVSAAALREAREETGFELDGVRSVPVALSVHRIPPWESEPGHLHLDLQFLFVVGGEVAPSSAELAGRWFDLDSLEVEGALEHTRGRVRELLDQFRGARTSPW